MVQVPGGQVLHIGRFEDPTEEVDRLIEGVEGILRTHVRPQGFQKSFAQLIAHDPYPGSSYGFGLGFTFSGYTPNLRLCYTDNVVGYGNSTNAIADSTRWNHVALVYSPTGVIIYLNGVPYSARSAAMPVLDLSNTPFYINKDIHNQGGDYKGEIDEIKIYNYALTQNEVREKMHLIQNEGTIIIPIAGCEAFL